MLLMDPIGFYRFHQLHSHHPLFIYTHRRHRSVRHNLLRHHHGVFYRSHSDIFVLNKSNSPDSHSGRISTCWTSRFPRSSSPSHCFLSSFWIIFWLVNNSFLFLMKDSWKKRCPCVKENEIQKKKAVAKEGGKSGFLNEWVVTLYWAHIKLVVWDVT